MEVQDSMVALVKSGPSVSDVAIKRLPLPQLRPGHVLVTPRAVGVCGSDIHMWHNKQSWAIKDELVLGHEMSGTIAEVAADITGWKVGDRVVLATAAHICGECDFCHSGKYNLCPTRLGYGALRDGSFSQVVSAEARVLHRVPDGVSFEEASMTEPYCVAYNALVERGSVLPGDTVVVQGVGPIGAISIQIARLMGAGTILAVGTDADGVRLDQALQFGADEVINISSESLQDRVSQLGDGLGADVVVDATGVSIALKDALEVVRPAGSIVKVGWGPQPLNFSLDPLVAKAVTLYGSFSHTWKTWERVLELFGSKRLHPQSVIGGVYALEEWEAAFSAMSSGMNVKSVVTIPTHEKYSTEGGKSSV